MTKTPVAVLAYNRPQYLDKCLNSIKSQRNGRDIHLFIDGPRTQEDQIAIQQSVSLSRQKISNIEIHASPQHVAPHVLNKRARDTIFENHDQAIFVSENLVLNDYYLDQLDNLYEDSLKTSYKIGALSLYPERSYSLEMQRTFKNDLNYSPNMFAYLMTRESYDTIYDDMDEYYSIVGQNYYQDHAHLLRYKLGAQNRFSGSIQDMTLLAMTKNDLAYITSVTNNLQNLERNDVQVFDEGVDKYNFTMDIDKSVVDHLKKHFYNGRDYRDFAMKVF